MKFKIKKTIFFSVLFFFGLIGLQKIYYQYQKVHTYDIDKTGTLDNSYAKNIKIQNYLMTSEQVAKLFQNNSNENPEYWEYQERSYHGFYPSYHGMLYWVTRLKNEGNKLAWGVLSFEIKDKRKGKGRILVLPPHMSSFVNYVHSAYQRGYSSRQLGHPEIICEWEKLYVKE